MIKTIDFIKGSEVRGSIMQVEEKRFIACTGTTSKVYKTEKGARKFMDKMGYVEVVDVTMDTVGNVVKVVELDGTVKDKTVIEINDNFVGIPQDLLKAVDIMADVEDLMDQDADDVAEKLNGIFKDGNVIFVDAWYNKCTEGNILAVGDTVKNINKYDNMDGIATVIAIKQVGDRFVVTLSNGCRGFEENYEKVDPQTDKNVAVSDLQKGDIIVMASGKQGSIVDVYPTAHGKYLVKILYKTVKYTTGSYTALCDKLYTEAMMGSKKFKVVGKDLQYAVKFNENKCPECGGTGILTHYLHHDGGICYKCKGSGKKG